MIFEKKRRRSLDSKGQIGAIDRYIVKRKHILCCNSVDLNVYLLGNSDKFLFELFLTFLIEHLRQRNFLFNE